ncbi:protein of unknown function [Geodermatophilus obscurus]|uniref:eCIS core domain-containing protein n=1 Tax=Geodermatophilus obscurus TaxID=1861 RepID=A0A1M7UL55_9ACTN|nr:DUF4157 domain-containing protein [Geodermatophilus obscurus]SHN83763.1 protein of unknown function [Geodermatophilus obscurus]
MATDVASADTEREPDGRPKALEEKADGEAAAAAAPSGGLGARQLRAKAAPGNAALGAVDDPAERAADSAADRVLRAAAATAPATAPAPPPAPGTVQPVRRTVDPAAEQRLPGAPVATPTGSGGARPGVGVVPDTTTPAGAPGPVATPASAGAPPAEDSVMGEVPTPAGEAPVVAPSVPSGPGPVESGPPAPEPEPPAPEGEAPARETPRVPNEVQDYLEASRGKGAPLPEASRRAFETAYGRPLDDVRVHDDRSADEAARAIGALAFTRGNDVYFRAGAYDPAGPEGKRLLAHELAHVVQQRPGVNRKTPGLGGAVVRRASDKKKTTTSGGKPAEVAVPDEEKGPIWTAPPGVEPKGTIDTSANPKGTLTLEEVAFPKWKADVVGTDFKWRRGEKRNTRQREIWEAGVEDEVSPAIRDYLEKSNPGKKPDEPYFAKSGTGDPFDYYIGSLDKIVKQALRPRWAKGGEKFALYDVDHKRDWQLYGEDAIANLWLFNRSKNRAAGRPMSEAMSAQVEAFMANASPYLRPRPRTSTVVKSYAVTFRKAVAAKGSEGRSANDSWEVADMGTAAHVAGLKKLTPPELLRLRGSKNRLQIFNQSFGGRNKELPMDDKGKVQADKWRRTARKGLLFQATDVTFSSPGSAGGTGVVGSLSGVALKNNEVVEDVTVTADLLGMPGLPFAASLSKPSLRNGMQVKGLSPVEFEDLELDVLDGLVGRGSVLPDSKLLKNAEISLVLDGSGVAIEASIAGGDLQLPGPFQVTGGRLTLSAGTGGIAVSGRIDFEIERLAKGHIGAAAAARAGQPTLRLEGEINFDTSMFTKAQLGLSYENGTWGVRGKLAVGPGKIAGIRAASARVEVTDETVTAAGEFETSLKGVDKGTLGFAYDPATGMAITGEILLGKGIPGIKGGKLAATVKEGTEGWSLAGAVTAEPDVPGLTGTVTGSYADGAFSVEADLGYERGQAKGTVKAGLTNRTLDAEGRPTGEIARDGSLTAYGGGTVTLAITPWLQGTVGLRLTPKGEIEVSGKVALPPTFDVFPEKLVERRILSVGIDIPIVGVAVAGQRIGIFATIKGGVTVGAGVGPGQLRDVALEVTYNPARPDDTTVTGSGTFVVPARAGMRVQVDGGIGAGIPVVSATAGVSVYGEVGVAGAISAGAAINWTPRTGIVLDARGELFVEPKFRFGIDAFVDVSADLLVTEVELYRRTWKLAGFEYGSNLRFGLAFPLHYESGKPFDLSFDQIQWTYPQINPGDVLGGLMKQLVG